MPAPVTPYVPDATDARFKDFRNHAASFNDPGSAPYVAQDPGRIDAEFFLKPVQDEILGLIKAAVALPQYEKLYTCLAGLNVGDPVYPSAANTVALALANDASKVKVFAFCAYKPSTTTCYVVHFYLYTGAGFTVNAPVYLSDAGAPAAVAGTISKIIGKAVSTTVAILYADAIWSEMGTPSELSITSAKGAIDKWAYIEEEITLGAGATTDSVANLLPANAFIKSVSGRVTVAFAGTFKAGDSGVDDRFCSGVSGALNTTFEMMSQAVPTAPYCQGSAAQKARLTPSGGGAAAGGKIRVTVFYEIVTPPTS